MYFVGIDVASETFTVSVWVADHKIIVTEAALLNTKEGIAAFVAWLSTRGMCQAQTIICMEATGVYNEVLCTDLVAAGYRVAVEPPLNVKRAFQPGGPKSDPVDSRQIAEYAFRFSDVLTFWTPVAALVQEIRALLGMRERLTRNIVVHRNARHALARAAHPYLLLLTMTDTLITQLVEKTVEIDAQIRTLVRQDPRLQRIVGALDSIPGVGLLLAAYLLVLTNGFQRVPTAREIAAYLGMAPLLRSSGSSLRGKPASRHYGPRKLRSLLHLAARSVVTHRAEYREYYTRMCAAGKPKVLVLNNVANKLLRVICAIMKSGAPYHAGHYSINPGLSAGR